MSMSKLLAKDPRASLLTQDLGQQNSLLPSILRTFNEIQMVYSEHMSMGKANSPFLMLDQGQSELGRAPMCSLKKLNPRWSLRHGQGRAASRPHGRLLRVRPGDVVFVWAECCFRMPRWAGQRACSCQHELQGNIAVETQQGCVRAPPGVCNQRVGPMCPNLGE